MESKSEVQTSDGSNDTPSYVTTLSVSPDENKDEWELALSGKKQVLRRNFGLLNILGLSLACTSTWEGILVVFVTGLEDGGPAGLVYGYIFCWIGYLCIIASIAELASMISTSSGQYHWVYVLAPARYKVILSYFTGWQSVIAWQAGSASACYFSGTLIQGLAVLNYPQYDFQRWHGTLLVYAVVLLVTFFNTILARFLPQVEMTILVIHLAAFVGILVPLVYLAPHGTASDVFAQFLQRGGYESKGVTFLVGIVTTNLAMLGADGAVHMSEEIHNSTTVVPWVMVGSIAINGALGFGMLIAVLFCIGDIDAALASPTGYPFMEIFAQAVGSIKSATAMASFITALAMCGALSNFAACSRMTWALARDNGLPGSRYIGHVNPTYKLPLWAIALTATVTCLLALINVGSAAAFNAIVSLVVAGWLSSYLLPVGLLLWVRITRPEEVRYGPWRLGWMAIPVNVIGLCWTVIATIFSFFPATVPVDAVTMNYSCLLFGAVCIFAIVFYVVYGRKIYKGPVIETRVAEQFNQA